MHPPKVKMHPFSVIVFQYAPTYRFLVKSKKKHPLQLNAIVGFLLYASISVPSTNWKTILPSWNTVTFSMVVRQILSSK